MDFNTAYQQLLCSYRYHHFLKEEMLLDMIQTQVQNKPCIINHPLSYTLHVCTLLISHQKDALPTSFQISKTFIPYICFPWLLTWQIECDHTVTHGGDEVHGAEVDPGFGGECGPMQQQHTVAAPLVIFRFDISLKHFHFL